MNEPEHETVTATTLPEPVDLLPDDVRHDLSVNQPGERPPSDTSATPSKGV